MYRCLTGQLRGVVLRCLDEGCIRQTVKGFGKRCSTMRCATGGSGSGYVLFLALHLLVSQSRYDIAADSRAEVLMIQRVQGDRKRYMSLLLLADEQPEMVARYIDCGDMWVLTPEDAPEGVVPVVAECLVTDEGEGVLEIKSLAVEPTYQRRGYGRALIEHVATTYAGRYRTLQVGTGDSPLTVPFYERCGFSRSHVAPNFFTNNYDHPIYEAGVRLVDMVYMRRQL